MPTRRRMDMPRLSAMKPLEWLEWLVGAWPSSRPYVFFHRRLIPGVEGKKPLTSTKVVIWGTYLGTYMQYLLVCLG